MKVYDAGELMGEVDDSEVDYLPNANYGGAWIGQERLVGFVTFDGWRYIVVSNGSEEYAYNYRSRDSSTTEEIEKEFNKDKLRWDSMEMKFVPND